MKKLLTLALALLSASSVMAADDSNAQEPATKLGKIYIGDTTIDLDDDEAVSAFNTEHLTISKQMMSDDYCVVLTLNDYEYEGTGVDGVGGIKYSGPTPLVLDLNGTNKISIVGDPNNEGATAGIGGNILALMGDGTLEINIDQSVRKGIGALAMIILSTSPNVMAELELSEADYKYFTGKLTVNHYGTDMAVGLYPMMSGYLGGGQYELNIYEEANTPIGLSGGPKLMVDASQINVYCPHGRGIVANNGRFIDTTVEVTADCAYSSDNLPPMVESTQAGVEYTVVAGDAAESALAVDLEAADALATLQAAKYMKIFASDESGSSMPAISTPSASDTDDCYNLQGQRINALQKGVVIKNDQKIFLK